ncbi:MAG: ABC-F family ATP-binding cassette domain-containing protein [Acidimicrobiales bacterium]
MHAQLHAHNLSFSHTGRALLSDVSLTVGPDMCTGIVGPNGSGKSTLLALLAGREKPDLGNVSCTPASATVGLMLQDRAASDAGTVVELVMELTGVGPAETDLESVTKMVAAGDDVADRYDAALHRWLALGGADIEDRLDAVLGSVWAGPLPGDLRNRSLTTLSGGERARVWLAAVLLSSFDVLLLDEPTNDLDLAGLAVLEQMVSSRSGPTVVVSHDRRFLERVVTDVLEIDPDPRRTEGMLDHYSGGWESYREAKAHARTHARERYELYERQKRDLLGRARDQRSWATKGVNRERRFPRDNDKAQRASRIERTENQASKARQAERALERLEVVDTVWEPWRLQFAIGQAERSGELVAELVGAHFSRGSFSMGPVDVALFAGDRVLIEGANGAGKSTLIGALVGRIDPIKGSRRLGGSVVVGELDQGRTGLHGTGSLLDRFLAASGANSEDARAVLAKFGLTQEHVRRPPGELSPGEQTRAVLALFQNRGVNTLVLDEPTNHLDLPAIEQLEQALERFEGTLIVVSHDRQFIESLRITRRVDVRAGIVVE